MAPKIKENKSLLSGYENGLSWRIAGRKTSRPKVEVEEERVQKANSNACKPNSAISRSGSKNGPAHHRHLRRPRRRRQGRHDQGASPSASARASSVSSRCRRRPTARRPRCTCSATCSTFPPPARSYLRPQLVQPRRRRARDGLLHARTARALPRAVPRSSKSTSSTRGIILIKFWLEVGNKEQERRFEARIDDPLRQWKLSPMDLPSRAGGTNIRAPATRCSRRPIPSTLPGTSSVPTTRSARGSTASRSC